MASKVVMNSGNYKCWWQGACNTQLRHVALVGSALTIGRGNLVDEVLDLHGKTTVAGGTTIAVWSEKAIVFRMWFPTAQEAAHWVSAMQAIAWSGAAGNCSKALRQLAVKQRRGERRRRYSEVVFRCLGHLACFGGKATPTAQWQAWQASRHAPLTLKAPSELETPGGAFACAIGEVPFIRKGMKVKSMRHVSLDGDLLIIGREEGHTEEIISLNGMNVMAIGCQVSAWLDGAMALRLWLTTKEEAQCWCAALQAATTLFVMRQSINKDEAAASSTERAAAAHAHSILKAQQVSDEVRESDTASRTSHSHPASAVRARRFMVPPRNAQ